MMCGKILRLTLMARIVDGAGRVILGEEEKKGPERGCQATRGPPEGGTSWKGVTYREVTRG